METYFGIGMQKHASELELNYTSNHLDHGKTRIDFDTSHELVDVR